MSGTATMRAMIELGLTDEQKLVLLAAIEKDAGPSRSTSAERQRRYRERWKDSDGVTSDVTALRNERDVTASPYEDTSTPLPSEPSGSSGGEDARASKPPAFPKPEWADQQNWTDFLANRRRKGRTNTPSAYKRFLDDIARLADNDWPPGRLLEHAAAEGWAGIYDPREKRNGRSGTNGVGRHQPDDGLSPTTRAAIAVFGPVERSPDSAETRFHG
jgi:hypothetical protein